MDAFEGHQGQDQAQNIASSATYPQSVLDCKNVPVDFIIVLKYESNPKQLNMHITSNVKHSKEKFQQSSRKGMGSCVLTSDF